MLRFRGCVLAGVALAALAVPGEGSAQIRAGPAVGVGVGVVPGAGLAAGGLGVGFGVGPGPGIYAGPYGPYYYPVHPGVFITDYQAHWGNGFTKYGPPVPTYGPIPGAFGGSNQRLGPSVTPPAHKGDGVLFPRLRNW